MVQKYISFISYRHIPEQRLIAKWLLDGIENFRIPDRRSPDNRLGKVFRDEDEIPTSADLSGQILNALNNSEFLLVICTPDTKESLWVNREVEQFIESGKVDKIIPILLRGAPPDVFPKALRSALEANSDFEPIAIDLRPREDEKISLVRARGMTRLLAGLSGVSFDSLWQRERRRRHAKLTAVALGLLLTLTSASALVGNILLDIRVGQDLELAQKYNFEPGLSSIARLDRAGERILGRRQVRGSTAGEGELSPSISDVAASKLDATALSPTAIVASSRPGIVIVGGRYGQIIEANLQDQGFRALRPEDPRCMKGIWSKDFSCSVLSLAEVSSGIVFGDADGVARKVTADGELLTEIKVSKHALVWLERVDGSTLNAMDSEGAFYRVNFASGLVMPLSLKPKIDVRFTYDGNETLVDFVESGQSYSTDAARKQLKLKSQSTAETSDLNPFVWQVLGQDKFGKDILGLVNQKTQAPIKMLAFEGMSRMETTTNLFRFVAPDFSFNNGWLVSHNLNTAIFLTGSASPKWDYRAYDAELVRLGRVQDFAITQDGGWFVQIGPREIVTYDLSAAAQSLELLVKHAQNPTIDDICGNVRLRSLIQDREERFWSNAKIKQATTVRLC